MHVYMQHAETLNPEQIREFLEAGEGIAFAGQKRAETYAWTQQLLVSQEYDCQGTLFKVFLCDRTTLYKMFHFVCRVSLPSSSLALRSATAIPRFCPRNSS